MSDYIEIDGYDDALYENVDVEELDTAAPYLNLLLVDGSGSMIDYSDSRSGVMGKCLRLYQSSIVNSKQADEIVVGKIVFNDKLKIQGFVKPEKLECAYGAGGYTALNPAIVAGKEMLLQYMDELSENGSTPRASFVILSDGWNNKNRAVTDDNREIEYYATDADARKAIEELQKKEVTVASITFGDEAAGIAQSLGIDPKNILDCQNNEHDLRKALELVSKSAISASKRASAGLGIGDTGFFDV